MKAYSDMSYDELMKTRRENNIRTNILVYSLDLLMILFSNPLFFLPVVYFFESNKRTNEKLSNEIVKKDEDIKSINAISDEIIDNIVKLADTLEVKNPVDVYYFFCEMLNKGYLSYDLNNCHFIRFSYYKDFEMISALTLNGHGVCRHISAFLNELYKRLGYESDIVHGFMKEINADDLEKINKRISFYENDEDIAKIVRKAIASLTDIKVNMLFSKFRYLNHAVTRVNFDDMTLLTDATNETILFPKFKDVFYSSPLPLWCFILDEDARKIEIEGKYEYNYVKLLSQIAESSLRFGKEKDLFRDFHKDNLDMLEEAESLTQKVLAKKY